MQLNNDRPIRRAISLTPLIDVVFLLLVFFMLASTFMKFTGVPVATTGNGPSSQDIQRIAIVHIQSRDRFSINGVSVSLDNLQEQLSKHYADGKDQAVIVPRPGATVADLTRTLTIARQIPFTAIHVSQ